MESTAAQSDDMQNVRDFLRETPLYEDQELGWLRPVAERSLKGELGPDYLEQWLLSQLDEFHPDERGYRDLFEALEVDGTSSEDTRGRTVRRLNELHTLDLDGADTVLEDVSLRNGLNILCTKDSSQQERAFGALARSLGAQTADAAGEEEEISEPVDCDISVETDEDDVRLTSENGTGAPPLDVRVFDCSLSQFLVQRTDSGEFEVAPLEAEKIIRLRENLDFLHQLFEYRLEELEWDIADDVVVLEDEVGFSLKDEFEPTLDAVESMEFSEEDARRLEQHRQELDELEDQAGSEQINRIEEAVSHLKNLMENIGTVETGDDGSLQLKPRPVHEICRTLREVHRARRELKNVESDLNLDALLDELPDNWKNTPEWEQLQSAAEDFTKSVATKVEELIDQIEGENAAWAGSDSNAGEPARPSVLRKRLTSWIDAKHDEMETVLESLRSLFDPSSERVGLLEDVGLSLSDSDRLDAALDRTQSFLQRLRDGETPDVPEDALEAVQETMEHYDQNVQKLLERKSEVQQEHSKNQDQIRELKDTVRDLKLRQAVVEHRDRILNYLRHRKELVEVRQVTSDLNQARQTVLSESGRFLQNLNSDTFRERLEEEYERLDFDPPEEWSLESEGTDSPDATYSRISPDDLTENLEGEDKELQAMADFLARARARDYEGLFLFKDPFQGLGRASASRVIRRLLDLTDEGHQVLIVIHDRSFFNALISLNEDEIHQAARESHQLIVHPNVYSWKKKTLVKRWTEMETRVEPLRSKNTGGSLARAGLSDEDLTTIHDLYGSMTTYLEYFLEVFLMKNVLNQFRPAVRLGTLDRLAEIASERFERIRNDQAEFSANYERDIESTDQPKDELQALLQHFNRMEELYHYQQV